jgi:hypothetical protein
VTAANPRSNRAVSVWWRRTGLALVGVSALWVYLSTITFTNDHFGRISPARQILVYGELPFRDFVDPGYFLTEFSSAGVQHLLGDNLLGEALLNSTFIAVGTVISVALAARVTGSFLAGVAVGMIVLLTLPRAYDYDKVLFFPLGVALCWQYIELQTTTRIVWIGVALVVGALFRYDTAVYMGGVAVVTLAAVHAPDWVTLSRRLGLLVATVLLGSLPALLFIHSTSELACVDAVGNVVSQSNRPDSDPGSAPKASTQASCRVNGGIANAVDQVVSYAVQEGMRTRITRPPPLSLGRLVAFNPPSQGNEVVVRWAASLDDADRASAASALGLSRGQVEGEAENRTWRYAIDDPSSERLRQLVNDPRVEDTHLIDRARFVLTEPESRWDRVARERPLLRVRTILPDLWSGPNPSAFIYYFLMGVPLAAGLVLLRPAAFGIAVGHAERARLLGLIALSVLLNALVLRDPVLARVGGMIAPAAVLFVWIAVRAGRLGASAEPSGSARRVASIAWGVRALTCLVLVMVMGSISVSAEWEQRLTRHLARPAHLRDRIASLRSSPSTLRELPSPHLREMIAYVRDCTRPDDRLYMPMFVPEVYFFAQRAFGAGMVVTFGNHWAEDRFQQRTINALTAQSVPIVILDGHNLEPFARTFAVLDRYLRDHYRLAGETGFGDSEVGPRGYRVLVRNDRLPTSTHPVWSLPCFG